MSKRPASFAFVAKTGKLRRAQKRPASMKAKQDMKVPYVRLQRDVPARGVRRERALWKRSLPELLSASNTEIVQMLQEDGLLPDWHRKVCPHCWKGKLTKTLRNEMPQYRCTANRCCKFVVPHHLHPLFQTSTGSTHKHLQLQAAVLLLRLASVKTASDRLLFHVNHQMYDEPLDFERPMWNVGRRRLRSATATLGPMWKLMSLPSAAPPSKDKARSVSSGSSGLACFREESPRLWCSTG